MAAAGVEILQQFSSGEVNTLLQLNLEKLFKCRRQFLNIPPCSLQSLLKDKKVVSYSSTKLLWKFFYYFF